jgi:hypothetical protein
MSESVINLFMQAPLAGVVVIVVVVFLQFIKGYNQSMMTFLTNQQETNHQFLREQREQSNEAISRLAEEIKAVGQEVAQVKGVVIALDAASKVRDERGRK